MVSDADLLALCLSAGPPGTPSHAYACRVWRRSVIEWRARDLAWRRARGERAAEAMEDEGRGGDWRRRAA